MRKPDAYNLFKRLVENTKKQAVENLISAVVTCRLAGYQIELPSVEREAEFADKEVQYLFANLRCAMDEYETDQENQG